MSYCTLKCWCGHEDGIDAFSRGGRYSCWECGCVWEIHDDPPTVLPTGFVMPGKRALKIITPGKKTGFSAGSLVTSRGTPA